MEEVLNPCLWMTEVGFPQKSETHSALSSNQDMETKSLSSSHGANNKDTMCDSNSKCSSGSSVRVGSTGHTCPV